MKVSITGTMRGAVKDMRFVRNSIVPGASSKALNGVAKTAVETPAVKSVSEKKQVAIGVVRWHHTALGERTKRRRLIRKSAKKDSLWVGWKWGTKSGEPGKVSVISLPGRTQNKAGVKAGRSGPMYRSAFIQTSKKGQLGAFTRTSRMPYPILFLRIDMTNTADAAFSKRVNASGPAYEKEFDRILKVDLRKKRNKNLVNAGKRLLPI